VAAATEMLLLRLFHDIAGSHFQLDQIQIQSHFPAFNNRSPQLQQIDKYSAKAFPSAAQLSWFYYWEPLSNAFFSGPAHSAVAVS
jgi:hypothetical protein